MVGLGDLRHRGFNIETRSRDLDTARKPWDVSTQVCAKATLGASNKHNGRTTPDARDARPRTTVRPIPLVTRPTPNENRIHWSKGPNAWLALSCGSPRQVLRALQRV